MPQEAAGEANIWAICCAFALGVSKSNVLATGSSLGRRDPGVPRRDPLVSALGGGGCNGG